MSLKMPSSASCWSCKSRHVRCDRLRPGCRRCQWSRVPCLGYARSRVGSSEHDDLAAPVSVPIRAISAELVIPALIAEQYTLATSTALQPEFGSLRILTLAFSNPGAASINVLWTASTTICYSLSTFKHPSQSLADRHAALEGYGSAIREVRREIHAYQGSEYSNMPLTTAVLLLALFELSIESDEHDTAWRHHLGGAHALAASLHPTGEKRKGRPSCALRNAVFDLRDLAPAMDNLFDGMAPPRKLDVRKQRVDVSGIHKQLLILKNAHERGHTGASSSKAHSAAFAWRLNLLTALLLTTRFLIDTSTYLAPTASHVATNNGRHIALSRLRDDLLNNIATTASQLLSHGTCSDLNSLCTHLYNLCLTASHHPPNTIEALTAIYPLALLHTVSMSHTAQCPPTIPCGLHLIHNILQHLADLCSLPKAASLVTYLHSGRPLNYKQVLDAVAVTAMGGALS